jgi:hypothetical protein
MTIVISLMSDTFLSRFQKSAEQFGVRGGEDQRYLRTQQTCAEERQRWKTYPRRMFRRKRRREQADNDIEQGQESSVTPDDQMRNEILEEVESIRRSVDQQVDAELGYENATTKREIADLGESEVKVAGAPLKKCTRLDDEWDADDEGINEDDVDNAFRAARGTDS